MYVMPTDPTVAFQSFLQTDSRLRDFHTRSVAFIHTQPLNINISKLPFPFWTAEKYHLQGKVLLI